MFFFGLLFSGKDRLSELSIYVFLYKIQHRDILLHAKPSNRALYSISNYDTFYQLGSWTYNTKPLSSFRYKKQKRMGVHIFFVGFFFFWWQMLGFVLEQEKGRKRLSTTSMTPSVLYLPEDNQFWTP
jgi:hypothetical protein